MALDVARNMMMFISPLLPREPTRISRNIQIRSLDDVIRVSVASAQDSIASCLNEDECSFVRFELTRRGPRQASPEVVLFRSRNQSDANEARHRKLMSFERCILYIKPKAMTHDVDLLRYPSM